MKPFQYRRVTRILTRLVQAIPFGGGPIHQPKRHRDDSAGDDARAELRQTSSASDSPPTSSSGSGHGEGADATLTQ